MNTTRSVKFRRLRLVLRRLWVHTIRRMPTREESVLRQIHERTLERREANQMNQRNPWTSLQRPESS